MIKETREARRATIAAALARSRAARERDMRGEDMWFGPEADIERLDREIAREHAEDVQRTREQEYAREVMLHARIKARAKYVQTLAGLKSSASPSRTATGATRSAPTKRAFSMALAVHGVSPEDRDRLEPQIRSARPGAEFDLGNGKTLRVGEDGHVSIRAERSPKPPTVRAYVSKLK